MTKEADRLNQYIAVTFGKFKRPVVIFDASKKNRPDPAAVSITPDWHIALHERCPNCDTKRAANKDALEALQEWIESWPGNCEEARDVLNLLKEIQLCHEQKGTLPLSPTASYVKRFARFRKSFTKAIDQFRKAVKKEARHLSMTMQGLACFERELLQKFSWDIHGIAGRWAGQPKRTAGHPRTNELRDIRIVDLIHLIREKKMLVLDGAIEDAIKLIGLVVSRPLSHRRLSVIWAESKKPTIRKISSKKMNRR